MKKSQIINNIKKKGLFSKKSAVAAAMSTLSVSVTLGAGVSQIVLSQSKYLYKGKTFNSYKELLNYVKTNSATQNIENNSSWSITSNGVTKKYTDPEALRNDVYKNYISSTNALVGSKSNGNNISAQSLGSTLKNNSSVVSTYKGLNGVAYENADDAYKSLYSPQNAFYFNNTYFQTRSDLNQYLVSQYLPSLKSDNSTNTIILKSPSGLESSPINLSSKDAFSKIDSFVKSNSNSSLIYTNQKTKESLTINSKNINTVANSVSLSDLDYIHTQSNQGESRYIIDNDTADSGNIIGPYFYDGVLDVGAFNNKSMWKKVNNVKNQVYSQSKIDISIGSFFSSIINDDASLNMAQAESNKTVPLLFRTLLSNPDGSSYDESFITQLGELSPKLKDAVVEANKTMMSGKKYNTFYKITVLYNFLLSRVVSWGLGQDVLNLIVDYFSNVADFIQEAIEFATLYNPELLKSKDGKTTFNVKTFFQIGNPEYDYNTSSEYFLTQIKENYPNLVALMTTYVSAQNNITMTGGLIPFAAIDNSSLISTGIFKSEGDYQSISKILEGVYNVFSSLNTTDMATLFVANSGREDVKALSKFTGDDLVKKFSELKTSFGDISLETMLSGIGAKNSKYYQLASSVLKTELRVYLTTGAITKGSYLWQLYSKDSNNDKLGTFVNFVLKNSDLASGSLYRIYIAFMIDKRQANNQFFTNTTTKTWTNFVHALSQLILFSLGSAALTTVTINNLYNHYSGSSSNLIPSPTNNPTLKLFNGKDKNTLNTSKAAAKGDLISARSSTRSDLFSSDVRTSSSIPSKEIVYADLSEFLNSAAYKDKAYSIKNGQTSFISTSTNGKTSFKYSLEETIYTEVVGSKNKGKTIGILKASDDAVAAISRYFNSIDELYRQYNNTGFISPSNSNVDSTGMNKRWDLVTNQNGSLGGDSSVINGSDGNKPSNNLQNRWGHIDSAPSDTGSIASGSYAEIASVVSETESFKLDKKSWWSGSLTTFNKIKDVISTIANFALSAFAVAFTALELFFFMYNLFSETTTQDFYTYTTTDGTQFIWDGGRTVSKFLGLSVNQTVGIDDMMLLNPVQITLPQVEEFYYFNGVKYYDNTEDLKKNQLIYMLNGGKVRNNNFKSYYTFDVGKNSDKNETLDGLVTNVLTSLGLTKNNDGSLGYTNLNKNSAYISSTSTTLYGVASSSSSDNFVTLAKTISETIRPIVFVRIPDLDKNNVATGTITDDGTKYPGNYWDGSKIVINDSSSKYLFDNSANKLKDESLPYTDNNNFEETDSAKALKNSNDALYAKFKTTFSLSSKKVWKDDLNKKDSFNNLIEVKSETLYNVKINGDNKSFTSLESATNYVLSKLNFVKNTSYNTLYIYEDKTYSSESELMKYVLSNCETK